jgi:hypothetical protein
MPPPEPPLPQTAGAPVGPSNPRPRALAPSPRPAPMVRRAGMGPPRAVMPLGAEAAPPRGPPMAPPGNPAVVRAPVVRPVEDGRAARGYPWSGMILDAYVVLMEALYASLRPTLWPTKHYLHSAHPYHSPLQVAPPPPLRAQQPSPVTTADPLPRPVQATKLPVRGTCVPGQPLGA